MTDVDLYKAKNDWLNNFYEEVSSLDFYRDVFPVGSFEREGHQEDCKGNGILTDIMGLKAKNYIVNDELAVIDEVQGNEFVVMSPISYSGRNRTAKNARYMYGITIDLDGVEIAQLRDLFYQAKNDLIPQPTYTINSGHGLHLYYLFEEPIPLYHNLHNRLKEFKYSLIANIWNRYTSTYTERDEVQYQGIFQGFRMVGTQSKLGVEYLVRAYRTGEKTTIQELNNYLLDKSKAIENIERKKNLSLHEAKEKYPAWYKSKIIEGKSNGRWHVKKDLYYWWLEKLKNEAQVGHRYHCITVLATYAIKCGIDEDILLNDALGLIDVLDGRSDDEHNRFTKEDVMSALKMYSENYVTHSRREAERVSGIPIPPNKRNHRKQAVHLERARAVQMIDYPNREWQNKDGRPKGSDKSNIVMEWQWKNPGRTKADCIRDTGLSKKTVYKWWGKVEKLT